MHRFLFRRKHYAAFKAENRDYVDTESSQLLLEDIDMSIIFSVKIYPHKFAPEILRCWSAQFSLKACVCSLLMVEIPACLTKVRRPPFRLAPVACSESTRMEMTRWMLQNSPRLWEKFLATVNLVVRSIDTGMREICGWTVWGTCPPSFRSRGDVLCSAPSFMW